MAENASLAAKDAAHSARLKAAHERAAARHGRLRAKVERRISALALARFVSFVTAAACAFSAWYDGALLLYGPIALVASVAFLVLVYLHRGPYERAPRLKALVEVHQRAAARLGRDFGALKVGEAPVEVPRSEPSWSELQLFGEKSLFALINRTALPAGRARLKALLTEGVSAEALPARQEAARELAKKRLFRHRLEAEGRLAGVDEESLEAFLKLVEAPAAGQGLKALAAATALLVVSTWVQIALSAVLDLRTGWRFGIIAQTLLFMASTAWMAKRYTLLLGTGAHRPFMALRQIFRFVERRRFQSPLLLAMQASLGQPGARPSDRMGALTRILESLAARHSPLVFVVANVLFSLEVLATFALERWRVQAGARLREDLKALGDLEALTTLGGFAHDHPDFGWPEVREGEPALAATELGHPLFAPEVRQGNDFKLGRGALVLITGSNMSGKSSFLRTLGINVHLAQAGAPICGRALLLTPCRLSTSIQITDAPEEGQSRFYAEVLRIKRVLDEVAGAEASALERPRLYLVDEMLSGTNSRERNLACHAIVRTLVGATRSFGLVTTHDLELVKVAGIMPERIALAHFADRFDGERLHFEYRLHEGMATTTNALAVLRLSGIPVPD